MIIFDNAKRGRLINNWKESLSKHLHTIDDPQSPFIPFLFWSCAPCKCLLPTSPCPRCCPPPPAAVVLKAMCSCPAIPCCLHYFQLQSWDCLFPYFLAIPWFYTSVVIFDVLYFALGYVALRRFLTEIFFGKKNFICWSSIGTVWYSCSLKPFMEFDSV